MDGRKTLNHNMNSKSKNIVTTPGGQDHQESLVVVNRDQSDEGVSSIDPDSDNNASAETDVPPGTHPRDMTSYIIHHRAYDTGENVAVATNLTLPDYKRKHRMKMITIIENFLEPQEPHSISIMLSC
ncbi:unnamed protein product [Macrosiphum euphorbiae]|uniref:Uncharacterized protein n=1 Tax=Macrosiphum euphorbiae TaxID=13131 RepID=A0AAV0VQY0_9HEMI|nr:unnamed protein product [Macrosiphum euphorbiae]